MLAGHIYHSLRRHQRHAVQLTATGAELAVLSNKPHDITEPMVRELFIHIPFRFIWGYSGKHPRKPAPDALLAMSAEWGCRPQDIILVGDSLFDARTAANAGCNPVLVAWGYARTQELATWGAPVFGSVDELSHYLLTIDNT